MIWYLMFIFLMMLFHLFNGATEGLSDLGISASEEKDEEGSNEKAMRLIHRILKKKHIFVQTLYFLSAVIAIVLGLALSVLWSSEWTTIPQKIASFAGLLSIMMIFGIYLPEMIGKHFPLQIAVGCIHIISFFQIVLLPFTFVYNKFSEAICWLFGMRNLHNQSEVTEEEILSMVNEGHELGVIESSEAEMISNIFEYGNKEAKDIMINRSNMVALDGKLHLGDAIELMLNEQYSRYPVYEENLDHIIGVLYLKDALRLRAGESILMKSIQSIKGLLREPVCIPETKNIDDIFKIMQSEKLQMVIVIDEYGQTSGLIAMEDILEEIVGNIMDEYDEEQEHIEEKGGNKYVIDGSTPLEELEDKLGIEFNSEFETLNGFMISKLEHIPEENEKFEFAFEGFLFQILESGEKKVKSVLVKELPTLTEDGTNGESAIEEVTEK